MISSGGPKPARRATHAGLVPRGVGEQARPAAAAAPAPPAHLPLREGHAVLQAGHEEQPQ